jgi:hypothetical protein
MPTKVVKGGGKKPYKIVDTKGKTVGSSRSKKKAKISSSIRNRALKKK